jgi:hypothetical protein
LSNPLSLAVIMATYNGERYLDAQLQSLLSQTEHPEVLIAADDGSTDRTLHILEQFAARAPFRVELRRNPTRLGYGENFLSAARSVDAELISFSDQDDLWLPTKIAQSKAALRDPEVVLAVHTATLIDAEERVLGLHRQGIEQSAVAPPLTLDPWGFFSGFTMTLRRSLLDALPAADRGLDINQREQLTAHDRWVYFLASCLGKLSMIETPLALYRQHGANLYGAEHASLPERLKKALANHHDVTSRALHHRAVALHRAELLERASATSSWPASALQRAAAHWRAVAQLEQDRLSVYTAGSRARRLKQLGRNLRNGTYRRASDGALSRYALARDLLSVVVTPAAGAASSEKS